MLKGFQLIFGFSYLVSLPKQTKQGNTVTVIKALKGEAFTTKEYYIGLSHTINAAEIRLNEEVSIKDIVLIDCEFVTLSWLVNITPTFLQTLSLIFEVGLSVYYHYLEEYSIKPF